jgi:hypothetical protein
MNWEHKVREAILKSRECYWKFKSEMCKHYVNGWCDRGNACTFAHSADELVPPGGGPQHPPVAHNHPTGGSCQQGTSSSSSVSPQPLLQPLFPPRVMPGPPAAKSRPEALTGKRKATTPTAAEGERRKQLRLQHPADVPGPDEDTPLDALVVGFRWREGECLGKNPNTACVAVLPHNGPLVWLSTEEDVLDLALDGPCWMVNAGVIVRCDCVKPVVSLGGMYQVFAPFLSSKPCLNTCLPDMDSMMPVMYNTCIQVQCLRDLM